MRLKVGNYYLLVIWRILLVYIIYTLCRVFFLIYNNAVLGDLSFHQLSRIFIGGLKFDTTAILYTNILYILFSFLPVPQIKTLLVQKILKYFYIIINFFAISINLADTVYFRFTLRRTSMTFFSEFTSDVKFFQIFFESIALYWYVFLLAFIFLGILILLSGKYNINNGIYDKNLSNSIKYYNIKDFGYKFYLHQIIALIVTVPVFLIGVRGGATRTVRPITLSNAGDYVDKAVHTAAVLNTPFSLIRTIGKNKFTYMNYFPDYNSMSGIYNPEHKENKRTNKLLDAANKPNVVILILESFGGADMKFLNKELDKNYTPFLDSLSKQGLLCTNAFANGRKSIDAVPSILASIPTLIEPFAVTPYANNDIMGLPGILESLGYYTAFFHGAPNNSMGIRAVSSMCGVKNYFGKDEYNNNSDFDGAWGIWDDKFLHFMGEKLDEFKEPFFATVFTLSSHHPYKVPKEYEDILPDGQIPLQKAIAYTDASLRHFFNGIKDKPWFENTIFVITPDHANMHGLYPKYANSLGNTAIPIIYYSKKYIMPGTFDELTQQIDIMPTVLDLLNYDKPYFSFGNSIFDRSTKRFVVNYATDRFQLAVGDSLFVRNSNQMLGIYDFKSDSLLQNNLIDCCSVGSANDDLFKAVIQQYVNRLIDNKLQ